MNVTQLVPMFGNLAFVILAFVVALSVIVAIHEYGHYIVGRWCGIDAEVFSIGFGPVLWSREDKRGTTWQLAALPIGGYVKFVGDANAASVGADESVTPPDPRRTMLGAPLWARTLTVAAGPAFNFIFAIAIFTGSILYQGRGVEPMAVGEIKDLPSSYVNELRPGDSFVAVSGIPFTDPQREGGLLDILPVTSNLDYTVLRDGTEIDVQGPFLMPPFVGGVSPRSAADDAGIQVNDVITEIDGEPVFAFPQVQEIVRAADGASLDLTLWRDGRDVSVTLSPRRVDYPRPEGGFETMWLIGINGQLFFDPQTEAIGPWEAMTTGVRQLWMMSTTSLSALQHIMFGKISTCNLSGPVGIAETSGSMAKQGAQSFIWFIGALSAAVGLINLFPIPVLDGGHLVFYAYEAIARRKPSERAVQVFMFVGLALILSMMSFTILNDTVLCP
ncbi:RIP metalloprotease RseP [Loktanella agnita]|uniref:RIP metalloprotease RseP n=1 Tax=Loktanella agnita TaxID=287097 RepID=UPI0039892405